MNLAFLALATSLVAVGVVIFLQVRTWPACIGLGVLGLAAVGILIAAIFNTDPIHTSRAAATFSGKMHVLGASLDFTPAAALLLSFSLARKQAWRPIGKWLFITAVVTWVTTAAFILALPHDGKFGPGILAGLFGRFLLVSYLGWLLTVGFHTIRTSRASSGQ